MPLFVASSSTLLCLLPLPQSFLLLSTRPAVLGSPTIPVNVNSCFGQDLPLTRLQTFSGPPWSTRQAILAFAPPIWQVQLLWALSLLRLRRPAALHSHLLTKAEPTKRNTLRKECIWTGMRMERITHARSGINSAKVPSRGLYMEGIAWEERYCDEVESRSRPRFAFTSRSGHDAQCTSVHLRGLVLVLDRGRIQRSRPKLARVQ